MIIGVDYRLLFDDKKAAKLKKGIEMIEAELNLLLNFKKYSLFFGNEMGLDLEKYLGLTNRTATFNLIRSDIEDLFRKYRRVKLKKIEMSFNDSNNSILVDVIVSMSGTSFNNIKIPLKVQN